MLNLVNYSFLDKQFNIHYCCMDFKLKFIVTNADACFIRAGLILPGVSAYNPLNPVSGLLLFCVLLL